MKKNLFLIAVVVLLAGAYVIFFTDWFRAKAIQISHTSRPVGSRFGRSTELAFGLGNYYDLTEVKVVSLDALKTNPAATPLWHLVSDDGSDSINHFFYGERIGGMDPAVEGSRPQPLEPGVHYRLYVAAGRARGEHDFQIGPVAGQ